MALQEIPNKPVSKQRKLSKLLATPRPPRDPKEAVGQLRRVLSIPEVRTREAQLLHTLGVEKLQDLHDFASWQVRKDLIQTKSFHLLSVELRFRTLVHLLYFGGFWQLLSFNPMGALRELEKLGVERFHFFENSAGASYVAYLSNTTLAFLNMLFLTENLYTDTLLQGRGLVALMLSLQGYPATPLGKLTGVLVDLIKHPEMGLIGDVVTHDTIVRLTFLCPDIETLKADETRPYEVVDHYMRLLDQNYHTLTRGVAGTLRAFGILLRDCVRLMAKLRDSRKTQELQAYSDKVVETVKFAYQEDQRMGSVGLFPKWVDVLIQAMESDSDRTTLEWKTSRGEVMPPILVIQDTADAYYGDHSTRRYLAVAGLRELSLETDTEWDDRIRGVIRVPVTANRCEDLELERDQYLEVLPTDLLDEFHHGPHRLMERVTTDLPLTTPNMRTLYSKVVRQMEDSLQKTA